MPRRLFVVFEILKRAGHAEVQAQPKLVIGAYKQMFAVTSTRFETAAFQPTCKLSCSDVFQDIRVPHIDVTNPLMQRCAVEVSLEYFNLRQLWHSERDADNRVCATTTRRHDCLPHILVEAWLERMSSKAINDFLRLLKQSPPGAVFNPWWQVDRQNDIGRNAPAIRRRHLRAYLHKRLGNVQVVVIGEALGYRGGHFTGIPMTSERILLGKKENNGIGSEHVFSSIKARRTSRREQCPDGFSEPTATIVWSSLLRFGLSPEEFVLW